MSNLPASVLQKIVSLIAAELSVQPRQVAAAVNLLDEGATVPFIARYRKEVTGNLDDTQLRTLEERLLYLRDMEDRRATILASIEEQGKLTDELRAAIEAAETKQTLEDLYLPYKPRRTQIAREAAWNRWRRHCWPTRRSIPKPRPPSTSTATPPPTAACPTSRPRWTARATSCRSSSAKRPNCSASCASISGTTAW
jgi:hypothetical protein